MRVRSQFPISVGAFLRRLVFAAVIALGGTAESRAQATFSMEQLDALTAPIALYPDTLLAQVMIASTYPAEVAQAAQWAQQNSTLQGTALDNALQQQPWDPSVKALVQTPSVLQQMNSKLDWTQQLGDAVLAQQGDVMDSVQRLRQRAQGAGNLMTTPQQTVVTQPAAVPGGQQTIVIEQADPQVLYVPAYEPQVVYGGWPYPSYPPYAWPAPVGYGYPGYAFGSGLMWGAGVAIGAAAWGNAFDWGGGDINVNASRNNFTNINNNRANNISNNRQNWQHNADNRRGSNYRDTATREKFGKTNSNAANARRESRGFDQGQRGNQGQLGQNRGGQGQLGQGQRPNQGQLSQQLGQRGGQGQLGQGQRPTQGQLSQQLGQRGGQGQLGQQRGAGGNQFAQNRSGMERRGQASGFDGARNGAGARQASARGNSSRQMMAQNASARGGGAGLNRGGGASRPQVNRGGGGGGRAAAGGGGRGGGGGGRGGGGGGRGGGGRR